MASMPKDVVIPIVFPDYLIRVDTPAETIHVPDLPFIDIPGVPSQIRIPSTTQRLPYLGHAGAAFFDGRYGTTKYYEYGRYDPAALGIVRNVSVPNVHMVPGGPTQASLVALLRSISTRSGQRGTIVGAYIELPPGSYARMLTYCQTRLAENSNPRRTPYGLFTNSCCHFMAAVATAGGAAMPTVFPPEPAGYIRVVRFYFPTLDFTPASTIDVPSLHMASAAAAAGGTH